MPVGLRGVATHQALGTRTPMALNRAQIHRKREAASVGTPVVRLLQILSKLSGWYGYWIAHQDFTGSPGSNQIVAVSNKAAEAPARSQQCDLLANECRACLIEVGNLSGKVASQARFR